MDEIRQIQEAIRSILALIAQRGGALSPEMRQMVEQTIAHASARINALRSAQPIPAGAEQLWVLAGENPQAFQSYLQTVPNVALNQLSQELAQARNIEQRLADRITLPSGEQQDGIPRAPLTSSNIYGFAYNPRNSLLRVRFQGGAMYDYGGVPPAIFKIFREGAIPARTQGQNRYGRWWVGKRPSLGASFFNMIRDRFPYQRVA